MVSHSRRLLPGFPLGRSIEVRLDLAQPIGLQGHLGVRGRFVFGLLSVIYLGAIK